MNDSLGTVAKEASTSFAGSMKQVITSIARLGAAFLSPAFEGIKILLPAIAHAFNQVLLVVVPLAEKMAGPVTGAFQGLADVLYKIDLSGLTEGLEGMGAALVTLLPLLLAFGGPLLTKIPVIGGLFKGLTPVIGATMGALILLFAVDSSTLQAGFQKLAEIIPVVLDTLTQAILTFVMTILPQLAVRLVENLQVIVEGLLMLVVSLIPIVAEALATLLPALLVTLMTMIPGLLAGAVELFMTIVEAIPVILPLLLEAVFSIIGPLVTALLAHLPALLAAAIQLFFALVTGVLDNLPDILDAIVSLIPPILAALLAALPQILGAAVKLFFQIVQGVIDNIPKVVAAIVGMIPKLVSTLVNGIPQIVSGAIKLFAGIIKGVIKNIPEIVSALITEVIPAAVKALIGAVPQLVQAGVDLMKGLARGILNGVGAVIDAITGAVGRAIDAAKNMLKIGSPSKVFDSIGRDTMRGYIRGVEALSARAAQVVARAMPTTGGGFGGMGGAVPVMSGGIGGFGTPVGVGGTTTNNNGATFAEGAIQVMGTTDPYKSALLTVNGIAERVAL
jgi:phage-related protein